MDRRCGYARQRRPASRRTGSTRDDGSASLDYVGIVTLVAAIIFALLLAAPVLRQALVAGVQKALCTAFGIGCDGSSSTKAMDELPPPEEPCETSSHSATAQLGLDVFSLTTGRSATFTKVRTADGQWHVTVAGKGDAGLIVGVGLEGRLEFGDTAVGLGASTAASGSLVGEFGQTWDFASEKDADDFIHAAEIQTARNTVVDKVPVIGWLADTALGAFVDKWNPPEPTESYVAGGVSGEGTASVSTDVRRTGAEGAASKLVGRSTRQDGETTSYYQFEREASGEIEAVASGSTQDTRLIAVTRSPEGEFSRLTLRGSGVDQGTATLGPDVTWNAERFGLPAFLESSLPASADTDTRAWSASLDLNDPRVRDAATDFLAAARIDLVLPVPITATDVVDANARIVDLLKDRGTISIIDYSENGANYGGGVVGALGIEFAFGADIGFEDAAVTSAQYWNGHQFVPWKECR